MMNYEADIKKARLQPVNGNEDFLLELEIIIPSGETINLVDDIAPIRDLSKKYGFPISIGPEMDDLQQWDVKKIIGKRCVIYEITEGYKFSRMISS